MLDAWSELPAWLRILIAVGMMVAGALIAWFESVRLGFLLLGVGFVMTMIGGKSQSERNGYRF